LLRVRGPAPEVAPGERPRGRALRAAGVPLPVLFVDADPVADHLARITRGWDLVAAPIDGERPCIAVHGTADGYTVVSDWLDGPSAGLTDVAAACAVVVDMGLAWIDARDAIALHGGAVEIAGRLVVLTGPRHVGKSTLTTRLAAAEGPRFFCDDMLPMAADSLDGIALGVAPRPRLPLPAAASAGFRDHVARHTAIDDGYYAYVAAPNIAPHGATAPIGAILLLHRRDGGAAVLRAASRADAVRALLLQNLTEDRDPDAVFARMHALMDRAHVLWLEYADVEDAARLILGTFAARGARPDVAPALQRGALPGAESVPLGPPAPPALRFRRRAGVAARVVDADLFLCDPDQRAVLHLNHVGRAVWSLLEQGTSRADTVAALAAAFPDAGRDTIDRDVARLFAQMRGANLIAPAGAATRDRRR
jgi:hypothetical protein